MQQQVAGEHIDEWEDVRHEPEAPRITEHEDEPNTASGEVIINTQFYDMEGVVHKNTGKILNFVEALREALIDLSKGGRCKSFVCSSKSA